ncbi:MAG: thioredoxin family protein [Saprospiraceae bacterium]|nr:thioredoxin family protein [Saprospiraceae bacterium]
MKRTILYFAAILCCHPVIGQDWTTDLDQAKAIAQEQSRDIIMVFQGSDWCVPCIKLDREVWSTEEFQQHADTSYVMLQVDFPRKRKNALTSEQTEANGVLAEHYNSSGIFPLVVKLSPAGHVRGKLGYEGKSTTEYITLLEDL